MDVILQQLFSLKIWYLWEGWGEMLWVAYTLWIENADQKKKINN